MKRNNSKITQLDFRDKVYKTNTNFNMGTQYDFTLK